MKKKLLLLLVLLPLITLTGCEQTAVTTQTQTTEATPFSLINLADGATYDQSLYFYKQYQNNDKTISFNYPEKLIASITEENDKISLTSNNYYPVADTTKSTEYNIQISITKSALAGTFTDFMSKKINSWPEAITSQKIIYANDLPAYEFTSFGIKNIDIQKNNSVYTIMLMYPTTATENWDKIYSDAELILNNLEQTLIIN